MPKKTNPIIIVLLVIVVALLTYIAFKPKYDITNTNSYNYPSDQTQTTNNPSGTDYTPPTNTGTNSTQVTWVKSPKFGLYYPSTGNITETTYLSPGQTAQGVPESQGIPMVSITFPPQASWEITWGGPQNGCTVAQTSPFQYGISTLACLKGMTANVGYASAREHLSSDQIKLFGDFILKNQ